MEYINLKEQYQNMKKQINERVEACMESADFIMGKSVGEFEHELADYVGMKHVISCGSGTDALQLIYMAYGIGAGDAVFCPAMTFIASVEPACLLGATPVFCEIDKEGYNILPESLERQIQRVIEEGKLKPKAIVAVDFLGNPADYDRIRPISEKYNLLLIEDAAQSIGAAYHGKKCGSLGDVAATSFFPSKPLGAYGDGGAIFTNNDSIADIVESLRVHGKGTSKYDNIRIGINSRLDTLQAEILRIKLEYLEEEIEKRQKIAERYVKELKEVAHVPMIERDTISSYAQFVICLHSKAERDGLKDYLQQKGIPTIIYYPNPLHCLPVFKSINTYGESLKAAEIYGETNLGIPFSPYISEEEQSCVIEAIKEYFKREQ